MPGVARAFGEIRRSTKSPGTSIQAPAKSQRVQNTKSFYSLEFFPVMGENIGSLMPFLAQAGASRYFERASYFLRNFRLTLLRKDRGDRT